jgi:hypothetical protein
MAIEREQKREDLEESNKKKRRFMFIAGVLGGAIAGKLLDLAFIFIMRFFK